MWRRGKRMPLLITSLRNLESATKREGALMKGSNSGTSSFLFTATLRPQRDERGRRKRRAREKRMRRRR